MEIILLIAGFLFIIGVILIIIMDGNSAEKFVIFGLTLAGTLCIVTWVNLYNESRDKIVNQSEVSIEKIVITITNEKDTISDTTYIYNPKK